MDHSVAELEQHVSMLKDRIMAVAAEIKALLAEDLPRFLEREIKKAFITHTDFASSLSNERLKSLKAEIVKRGPEAADAVLAKDPDSLFHFSFDVQER